MKTLPAWMLELGTSVDIARKLIRLNPDLKQLGTLFGPTRLYDRSEAERIAGAVREYGEKRRGAVPAVVG